MHACLHANAVVDGMLDVGIQAHQHIDRASLAAFEFRDERRQQRPRILHHEEGRELTLLLGVIVEWIVLRGGLQEEIEWILDRHLDHQIDLDIQPLHRLGKHQPRKVVGLRILLPIDEMVRRPDFQAVGEHV